MARQLSQNEIKSASKKEEVVVVYNISKQAVIIQLSPPINPKTGKKVDFFVGEQSVTIPRGKSAKIYRNRLNLDQINNLQRTGMLRLKTSA